MGRLVSSINYAGFTIGGTVLGEPAVDGDNFVWDGDVPDGRINRFGTAVTPNPDTGPPTPNEPLASFASLPSQPLPDAAVSAEVVADLCTEAQATAWVEETQTPEPNEVI